MTDRGSGTAPTPAQRRRLLLLLGCLALAGAVYAVVGPRLNRAARRERENTARAQAAEQAARDAAAQKQAVHRRLTELRGKAEGGQADARDYAELAALLSGEGDAVEALKTVDRGTARFPNSVSLWATRANLLQEQGKLGQALDAFRTAGRLDPHNARVAAALANFYLGLGWAKLAAAVLDALPAEKQSDPSIRIARAGIALQTADYRTARSFLAPFEAGAGGPPEVLVLAGQAAAGEHDWTAAAEYYQQALKASPSAAEIRTQLAAALTQAETPSSFARAEAVCREGLAAQPNDASLQRALGLVLVRQGRTAEALALLLPLAEHERSDEVLLGAVSRCLAASGRQGEARDYAGRASTARAAAERITRTRFRANLKSDDPAGPVELARLYLAQGNVPFARLELKRALIVRPGYTDAVRLLASPRLAR